VAYATSADVARTAYTTFERTWGKRGHGVVNELSRGERRLEDAADDECDRAAPRGVPPPREDAVLAPVFGGGPLPPYPPKRPCYSASASNYTGTASLNFHTNLPAHTVRSAHRGSVFSIDFDDVVLRVAKK
jgi:hypothetical protein